VRAPSVTHALALRRLVVAGGALGASLLAHCAAMGDLALTPAAPVAWGGLLAIVTLVGGRRRFRPRGLAGSLVAMLVAQGVVHLAMTWAPWAFGLAPHHHDAPLIAPAALVAHAAAALALALLAARLEAWLARALAVAGAVRRWLAARPARAAASAVLPGPPAAAPRSPRHGSAPCRGPPLPRPA
jgi:hypothetical protein